VTYKRALELAEQQLSVNPGDAEAMSFVAYFYSRLGNREKALKLDGLARDKAPDAMYVYYNSALVHAEFGETDDALDALERTVALDYQKDLLSLDPAFESLRGEERFKRLVQ
jgi:tetratricopeptide (TPR) repeat protein